MYEGHLKKVTLEDMLGPHGLWRDSRGRFYQQQFLPENPEVRYEELAERLWNLRMCSFSVSKITVIPITDISAAAIS